MLSLAIHSRTKPVPVLRWSLTQHRRIDAIRDRIMGMCGTDEPLIEAPLAEFQDPLTRVSRQWRKPLTLDEVNRMAPTPAVRAREGRP
jgi:hypothetical protein